MKFKFLLIFILLSLFIPTVFGWDGGNREDYLIVALTLPGFTEFDYSPNVNISDYKPVTTDDDKIIVKWNLYTQTGSIPPGDSIVVESSPSFLAFERYEYEIGSWTGYASFLKNILIVLFNIVTPGTDINLDLSDHTVEYPLLPPIVFGKVRFDCESDGKWDYNYDTYEVPVKLSYSEELRELIYDPTNSIPSVHFQPPIPFRTQIFKCIYDLDENATYNFISNVTMHLFLEPNVWSAFVFDEEDRVNLYPGYFLSSSIVNQSLEGSCGVPGTMVGDQWSPNVLKGCWLTILQPVSSDGIEPPVIDPNFDAFPNGSIEIDNKGLDVIPTDEDSIYDCENIETGEECENCFPGDEDGLKKCHQQVAFKDFENDNDLFNFGISIVRMIFSFVLLIFYVISITIIGFVFATLIPMIFSRIMLIFSRATRLQ